MGRAIFMWRRAAAAAVCLSLAAGGARAVTPKVSDADLWSRLQSTRDLDALRDFIASHRTSRFATPARTRLAELEAVAPMPAPSADASRELAMMLRFEGVSQLGAVMNPPPPVAVVAQAGPLVAAQAAAPPLTAEPATTAAVSPSATERASAQPAPDAPPPSPAATPPVVTQPAAAQAAAAPAGDIVQAAAQSASPGPQATPDAAAPIRLAEARTTAGPPPAPSPAAAAPPVVSVADDDPGPAPGPYAASLKRPAMIAFDMPRLPAAFCSQVDMNSYLSGFHMRLDGAAKQNNTAASEHLRELSERFRALGKRVSDDHDAAAEFQAVDAELRAYQPEARRRFEIADAVTALDQQIRGIPIRPGDGCAHEPWPSPLREAPATQQAAAGDR